MKKSLIITLLVLASNIVMAQMHDPVKWTTDVKDLGNNEFQVDFKAKIDNGWYLYSQDLEPGGPLPSEFDFSSNGDAKLVGKIQELGKAKEGTDPIFETFVKKYSKSVTFRAKVKTKKPSVSLTVPLTYMSCNDENCVKLDEEFSLKLKASAKPAPAAAPKPPAPAPKPPVVKKPAPPPPPPPPPPAPAPKKVIAPPPPPPPAPAPKVITPSSPPPVSRPAPVTPSRPSTTTTTTPINKAPITTKPAPAPVTRTVPSTTSPSAISSSKSGSGSNTSTTQPIGGSSKNASGGNQINKGGGNGSSSTTQPSVAPAPATSKDAGGNTAKKEESKDKKEEVAVAETKEAAKEEAKAEEVAVVDEPEATADKEEEATEETLEDTNADAGINLMGGDDDDGPKIEDPVSWEFSKEDLGNNEYMLNFKATVEEGWYIYSQNIEEGGPLPTSVNFEDIKGFEVVGEKAEEVSEHMKKGFDDIFEMEVTKFAKEVSFQQKIKATDPNASVNGYVRFMSCDAEKCLPPQEEEFNFALGTGGSSKTQIIAPAGDDDLNPDEGGFNWLGLFFGGMLGGLLALVTPCVFPMIPLTVSFFTKGSGDRGKAIRNALFYGFSIIFIYTGLGTILALVFGGDILNWMATSPVLNIIFFVIFIIFAFSFFGFFELTLPSSFVNKTSSMEDSGGFIGIFFMAATLALVSFSCTGPILGSVLGLVSSSAASSAGSASSLVLVVVMLGFSIAMALPFTLFAIFPTWLNNLPKSGSWLNTLKVVLGFVEVALAFKFLSTADMVMQWGLIKRETFIILWMIPAILAGVYLLGKIKFPHDGPIAKLGFGRIFFAGAFFLFALYLGNGLRSEWVNCKNQLSLISGFPPPTFYSYRHQVKGSCNPNHNKANIADGTDKKSGHKAAHCPLDLDCVHDFDEAFAISEETGKPIFIDFTGWGCVNCRQMEENVWSKPGVLEMLQKDYVVVSLYVDERTKLDEKEQLEYVDYKGRNKTLRTIGDKWTKLQIDCYQSNSQPYYVLLNSKGDMLKKKPIGVASTEKFKNYLAAGLTNFNKNVAEAKPLCNR